VTKFEPLTVSVKLVPPAVTELGEIEVVVGAGLLIVNVWLLLVPPPGVGLKTVIDVVPAETISEAEIKAVI
jgi:hypothetical protein